MIRKIFRFITVKKTATQIISSVIISALPNLGRNEALPVIGSCAELHRLDRFLWVDHSRSTLFHGSYVNRMIGLHMFVRSYPILYPLVTAPILRITAWEISKGLTQLFLHLKARPNMYLAKKNQTFLSSQDVVYLQYSMNILYVYEYSMNIYIYMWDILDQDIVYSPGHILCIYLWEYPGISWGYDMFLDCSETSRNQTVIMGSSATWPCDQHFIEQSDLSDWIH